MEAQKTPQSQQSPSDPRPMRAVANDLAIQVGRRRWGLGDILRWHTDRMERTERFVGVPEDPDAAWPHDDIAKRVTNLERGLIFIEAEHDAIARHLGAASHLGITTDPDEDDVPGPSIAAELAEIHRRLEIIESRRDGRKAWRDGGDGATP